MVITNKRCRECLVRFVCASNITPKTINCKNVQKNLVESMLKQFILVPCERFRMKGTPCLAENKLLSHCGGSPCMHQYKGESSATNKER